jgi:hypothetical protein
LFVGRVPSGRRPINQASHSSAAARIRPSGGSKPAWRLSIGKGRFLCALDAANIQLQRDRLEVGGKGDNGFAELPGLERDEAAPCCAGQTQLLSIMEEIDLAIDESVVEILPRTHHVAEFAMAAGFDTDPPPELEEKHPSRERRLGIAWGGNR